MNILNRNITFHRIRTTFGILVINRKTFKAKSYFTQLSIIEPWSIPKIERKRNRIMVGWLFLYFGIMYYDN